MYSDEGRQYWVLCTNTTVRHWWDRFLREGYRHCSLLIWEGVVWLHIEPTLDRTRVAIIEHYEPTSPAEWVEDPGARLFRAKPEGRRGRMRALSVLRPFTCVEEVKALLGIRAWWIFTPWQLAQHLRRRNGTWSQEAETDSSREGSGIRTASGDQPAGCGDQREAQSNPSGADWLPRKSLVG